VLQPTGLLEPRRHDRAGILGRRAMILRNKFKDMFRNLDPGVLVAAPPNPIMVNNPFETRIGCHGSPRPAMTSGRSVRIGTTLS
jgi:hypothetical protein